MKTSKNFLIALAFLAACNSADKTEPKTELGFFTPYYSNPEKLNGKIKKVIEKNYLATESEGKYTVSRPLTTGDRDSIGWTNDFIASFDERGVIIQCDEIDEKGNVLSSSKSKIEDGKVVSNERYHKDTLYYYNKLYYNTAGILDKMEYYTPDDTLRSTSIISNDENGNIDTVTYLKAGNQLTGKSVFTYSMNNRVGFKYLNTAGEQTSEQVFKYNESGFVENQLIKNLNEEINASYSYKKDDRGNWIECAGYDGKYRILATREIEYYE